MLAARLWKLSDSRSEIYIPPLVCAFNAANHNKKRIYICLIFNHPVLFMLARVHCDMTVDFITGFPDKRHTVAYSLCARTAPNLRRLGPTSSAVPINVQGHCKCILFQNFLWYYFFLFCFYFCLPQKNRESKAAQQYLNLCICRS